MTNATGVTQQESTYYPLGGEQRVITNTVDNRYKFTGLERDSESGLDHTLFRMYPSNLDRWLSPDPVAGDILNPQSLNRYAYVLNNPTNFIDPLGLDEGVCTWIEGQLAGCTVRSDPPPAGRDVAGSDLTGQRFEAIMAGLLPGQCATFYEGGMAVQTICNTPQSNLSLPSFTSSAGGGGTTTDPSTTGNQSNDVPLPPNAQYVFGEAGKILSPLASPWAPVAWYSASAAAALAYLAVPAGIEGLKVFAMTHPTESMWTMRFANSLLLGGAPTSYPAIAGRVVRTAWNWWKD